MRPQAGQLRERLTLQVGGRTVDAGGGWSTGWTDVSGAEVAGSVEPLEDHERIQAMQTDAQSTHRVVVRYRTDVTAKHRWKWIRDGVTRFLRITSAPVNPDQHRQYLSMFAAEDRG